MWFIAGCNPALNHARIRPGIESAFMKPLAPAEALHALVARMNPLEPVEIPLDEAPSGVFLAEIPPGLPAAHAGRVASVNGFGLPSGVSAGDVGIVRGLIGPGGSRGPGGVAGPKDAQAAFACWRLESGAPVPEDVDRILPPSGAVLEGEGRIRIRELPRRGSGITRDSPGPSGAQTSLLLDARLRAVLEARNARAIRVFPPFAAAFAIVGDEIVDSRASPASGERRDLVGPWLEEGLLAIGVEPVPLGIIGDQPEAIRSAILHLRARKVDVLVLAGGLGCGVSDRTVEGLARFELGFSLAGVALEGAPGLLLAKTAGLDIVGIGGQPLEAAAAFDLFVRPALRARRGAPRSAWDWTAWPRLPLEEGSPGAHAGPEAPPARVRPAALAPGRDGIRVRAWEPDTPLEPVVPGQEGWALIEGGDTPVSLCRYIPRAPVHSRL